MVPFGMRLLLFGDVSLEQTRWHCSCDQGKKMKAYPWSKGASTYCPRVYIYIYILYTHICTQVYTYIPIYIYIYIPCLFSTYLYTICSSYIVCKTFTCNVLYVHMYIMLCVCIDHAKPFAERGQVSAEASPNIVIPAVRLHGIHTLNSLESVSHGTLNSETF